MKKIIGNQKGMTLVEITVSFAIATILLVSVFGGLLFAQKTIVYNDAKNNSAAEGQELLDEIGNWLASGIEIEDLPEDTGSPELPENPEEPKKQEKPEIFKNTSKVDKKDDFRSTGLKPKQYCVEEVYEIRDIEGKPGTTQEVLVGYNTYVRVYYLDNNNEINFDSFTRKKKSAGTI